MSRHEIEGMGICYLHEGNAWKIPRTDNKVWHVEYSNGWVRRTTMDHAGRAVYTRWIRPKDME